MNEKQVVELLLQSLEHQTGGVLIYEAALKCVVNKDLYGEWQKYLHETRRHARALSDACVAIGVDPDRFTPGRRMVQELGWGLVAAMEKISVDGPSQAAELLACECVVMAETKDHLNRELLAECADRFRGEKGEVLKALRDESEDGRDGHFCHARNWCRELWMASLGMHAILPPPEERSFGQTALGTAGSGEAARQAAG